MSKLKNLNFQYIFSYLGLFPYLYIIFDKYFFLQINNELYLSFTVYYSLIIIVFIGSLSWDLNKYVEKHIIIFGFIPSLFAVLMIVLSLIEINHLILFLLLIFFFILQLFFENLFIYSKRINKKPMYFLRLPLTIFILISLTIIKY